jgi:hypothetical protein
MMIWFVVLMASFDFGRLTSTTLSKKVDAFTWCHQMGRKQTSPTSSAWITM